MKTIYLDNAATSFPKPPQLYKNVTDYFKKYGASPGRGGYKMVRDAESVMVATRSLLAQLFHVQEPDRIIFTLNATDALNIAIKGCLRPGDHVVTTEIEHNSVVRPLNRLQQEGRIKVTSVRVSQEGLVDPEEIKRAFTNRTRLVVMAHASNVTGTLQTIEPIGQMTRAQGALFLVDAAQTAGSVPIDVEKMQIDLLAFPGHKALLGPSGTGGLYVGPRANLRPWREGGTGVFSEAPLQPEAMPYLFEAGSPNILGISLLQKSLEYILKQGVSAIRAEELRLTQQLLKGLRASDRFTVYGPTARTQKVAVVSINIQGHLPETVGKALDRLGIAVRAGLHCAPGAHRLLKTFPSGTVRISPGFFTSPSEIDGCVDALLSVACKHTPRKKAGRQTLSIR